MFINGTISLANVQMHFIKRLFLIQIFSAIKAKRSFNSILNAGHIWASENLKNLLAKLIGQHKLSNFFILQFTSTDFCMYL